MAATGLKLRAHGSLAGKKKTPNAYGAPPYAKAHPEDWIVEDSCSAPQTYELHWLL